nr:hypothetical protein [Tanacetum cinerariifolium]
DVQVSTTVAPLTLTAPTLHPPTIPTIFQLPQAPTPPTTTPIKVAVQIQSDRLQDEAQYENEEFLNIHDENIQKIIKEQVKEQVKIKMKNPPLDQTEGPNLTKTTGKSSEGSKSHQKTASESAPAEEPMQTT